MFLRLEGIDIEAGGYKSIVQEPSKVGKSERNSGGLALLYKNELHDWISVEKGSPNFLWFRINKHYTTTAKHIFVCGI